jgi:hypothetical protein
MRNLQKTFAALAMVAMTLLAAGVQAQEVQAEERTTMAESANGGKEIAPVSIKTNRGTLFQTKIAKGVYSVGDKGVKLFTEPKRDADTILSRYTPGDVIMNVEDGENNWVSTDDGRGGKVYMHRSQLQYVPVDELRERLGADAVIEVNDDPGLIVGYSVFRGWRAGKYGLWLAIIALGILVLYDLVYIVYNNLKYDDWDERKLLRVHGFGLAVVSLLEIWYYSTLGIKSMSWFLRSTQSDEYLIGNYLLFIFVAAIQSTALYLYLYGIQKARSFRGKSAWIPWGLVISGLLYLPAIEVFHISAPGGSIFGLSHEWYILLCMVVGQLPLVLNMNLSYRRQVPAAQRTSIGWEMFFYLIAAAATLCIALMSAVILIAVILFYIFAFALLAKTVKGVVSDPFGGINGSGANAAGGVKPSYHCCASCARNTGGYCAEYSTGVSDPLGETNCPQFRF